MQQMLDFGASTDEVAQRFATSTDTIDRWRAVLALPATLLALVREGTVEISDIADLGELADDEEFVAAVVAVFEMAPERGVERETRLELATLTLARYRSHSVFGSG
jgi:hypothetical protein